VPYGKYETATILDTENINVVSRILQKAEITHSEYSNCYSKITEKSFVYFDPPYKPLTKTASFTTYTGTIFNDNNQIELANFFQKIDRDKGAKLMLSNSDPMSINPKDKFFENAYKGYNIFRVNASRAVNCSGTNRGKISEILVVNYL